MPKSPRTTNSRHVFTTRDAFVHYLVTSVICRGYWFYVTGRIPDGKDPTVIDQKLIAKYDAGISKSARWRRKKLGRANVRYVRWNRLFVLFATKGDHPFFQLETGIKDIRKVPLKVGGYSLSFRRDGHPDARRHRTYRVHVRIEQEEFNALLAKFDCDVLCRSTDRLVDRLYRLPYLGYAPVRRQLCLLLRRVNTRRRLAGRPSIPKSCLFFHRIGACNPSTHVSKPQRRTFLN